MSVDKIIKNEAMNDGAIHLYLEGMFWKAYQRSAYLFVKNVATFKVTKRKVKTIGMETVSLGFPKASLLNHFKHEQIIEINEKELKINGYEFDQQAYSNWFSSVPFEMRTKLDKLLSMNQYASEEISKESKVIDLIRTFRIEKATPMDCMLFINKAKEILDGNI